MSKKSILIFFSISLLVLPAIILAAPLAEPVQPVGGYTTLWGFFLGILENIIWMLFVAVAIVMFIYAGFMFVTASGEPAKLNSAKMALIGGIIGVIVAILAISLPNIIQTTITPPTPAVAPVAPPSTVTPLAPDFSPCTNNNQCASNYCDPTAGTCSQAPVPVGLPAGSPCSATTNCLNGCNLLFGATGVCF